MPKQTNQYSAKGARPFTKWAGGKRSLLPNIFNHLPDKIGTYFEPFVGGGALLFALAEKSLYKKARINDINERLIRTYQAIKSSPKAVIAKLYAHEAANSLDYFCNLRGIDIDRRGHTEVAAWMIYLNRTCFNGLYRVNKKGEFNVPYGKYENPTICDADNLRAVAEVLKNVECNTSLDFAECIEHDAPKKGDFVYFDPPYMPRHGKEFTRYQAGAFGLEEHTRLRNIALALKKRGVNVMISNSGADEVRDLYRKGFKIIEVWGNRSISASPHARGAIPDLLIL